MMIYLLLVTKYPHIITISKVNFEVSIFRPLFSITLHMKLKDDFHENKSVFIIADGILETFIVMLK